MSDRHEISEAPGAPKAIGPYSPAVRAGDLVFCSGQIALDPQTGEMSTGDVRAQTERVLANLKAVLEAAGSGLAGTITSRSARDCRIFMPSGWIGWMQMTL